VRRSRPRALHSEGRSNSIALVSLGFEGGQFQTGIYLSGGYEWPLTAADWESKAREQLEQGPFDYVAGGAGSEATMRANLDAFDRRRLRPRMLTGNVQRDLAVVVLGKRSAGPFFLAPIGVLSIVHPEGELAVARAAAANGIPILLSSAASHSIEEVADAMGDAPRWFQLYWVSDRKICESFVRRAEAAGYGAIVVTLDTLVLGWRPRDLANTYLPFIQGEGCAQFFTDPVFRSYLAAPPEEDVLAAAALMLSTFPNLALTWDDLDWLRGLTELPLIVKGVLTAEDALEAKRRGVDGIIVSNHGGRQVDGAVASLDALVEVRDALGDDTSVLVDSGIRSGADVLKAIALGADAVLLGRPYVWGLAVGGQEGVEVVIRQFLAETDLTLALAGGTAVRDLDRSALAAVE
jgi:lactate 2-monooxygenase